MIDASFRVTVGLRLQLAGSGPARLNLPVLKSAAAGGGKDYLNAVGPTPQPRGAEAAQPPRPNRCRAAAFDCSVRPLERAHLTRGKYEAHCLSVLTWGV